MNTRLAKVKREIGEKRHNPSTEVMDKLMDEDTEAVKAASMWAELLEKIVTDNQVTAPLEPEKTGHVDDMGSKQGDETVDTSKKNESAKKPPMKKTTCPRKIGRGIVIQERVVVQAKEDNSS
ncbi:hypothetical protein CASFOL_029399 [Castilleja foliolosa]|uniref:Uncharacterized protein n=1 Tax=Castilleja foliolosa TaxID=1961234 RepID=A0ABD3CB77_9LAMI